MLSRGHRVFPLVFFGLTVLKNFVGNAFNLPEIFGNRNFICMRTENHVLQSNFFVSYYAENSWEPLPIFRIFGISETFMRITVFLRFFLSHITEKFREEPSNVSKSLKCEVSKNKLNKNGISRFSVESFSPQSAERFRCGTLRYMRIVRLSKNFMARRVISLLSVEFFSRILPIKLGRESLFVSEPLGHRRLLCSVAGYRDSPLIFSASQSWKISSVTPSTLGKISGIETFCSWKRKTTFFCRIFFVSQNRKKFVVTTPKFQIIWDLEKLLSYHDFPSNFFVSQYQKISWGNI